MNTARLSSPRGAPAPVLLPGAGATSACRVLSSLSHAVNSRRVEPAPRRAFYTATRPQVSARLCGGMFATINQGDRHDSRHQYRSLDPGPRPELTRSDFPQKQRAQIANPGEPPVSRKAGQPHSATRPTGSRMVRDTGAILRDGPTTWGGLGCPRCFAQADHLGAGKAVTRLLPV